MRQTIEEAAKTYPELSEEAIRKNAEKLWGGPLPPEASITVDIETGYAHVELELKDA